MHKIIRPYSHPTTVVVIDDNQLFLNGLDFELPDGNIYQLHHEPETALAAVNHTLETEPLARRVFTPASASSDMSYATMHLDLSLIEQEIKLAERFRRISVAVIDYSMPSMDGIEFCKAITNRDVKRLLLTGVADEKLAVAAFNDGLIDRFLAKQTVTALETIFDYVDALIEQYFADLERSLHQALAATMDIYNRHSGFNRYFAELLTEQHIVEYYSVGDPAGFLLLDGAGRLRRLLIATPASQSAQARYAGDRGASAELVGKLERGELIGYFVEPPETFFESDGFDWLDYLHEAKRIDPDIAVAIVTDPPTDIDYDPTLTSYRACADRFRIESVSR